jgi:hypothetical protein
MDWGCRSAGPGTAGRVRRARRRRKQPAVPVLVAPQALDKGVLGVGVGRRILVSQGFVGLGPAAREHVIALAGRPLIGPQPDAAPSRRPTAPGTPPRSSTAVHAPPQRPDPRPMGHGGVPLDRSSPHLLGSSPARLLTAVDAAGAVVEASRRFDERRQGVTAGGPPPQRGPGLSCGVPPCLRESEPPRAFGHDLDVPPRAAGTPAPGTRIPCVISCVIAMVRHPFRETEISTNMHMPGPTALAARGKCVVRKPVDFGGTPCDQS